jgi:hypothetical protein
MDLYTITENKIKTIAFSVYGSWMVFAFFQGGEFPLQLIVMMLFVYYGAACSSKLCIFGPDNTVLLPSLENAIRSHD